MIWISHFLPPKVAAELLRLPKLKTEFGSVRYSLRLRAKKVFYKYMTTSCWAVLFSQREKETQGGVFNCCLQLPNGSWEEGRSFLVLPSERVRSTGHKLQQGKFQLGVRQKKKVRPVATQNVTRWLREGMKNPSLGMLRFWVEETLCFEQGVCCRWFPEGFPEVSRGHFHCKIFLVSIRWLVQDFSSPRRLILVLSFWSSMVIAFHVSFINIMLTGVRNGVCGDSAFVKHVLTEGLWLHVCFTVSK